MKVKITNKSFNKGLVKGVVRALRPSGISNFNVEVKNGRWCRGRYCYYKSFQKGHDIFGRAPKVVATINPKQSFPLRWHPKAKKGYLPIITYSLNETLVYILAHELRHAWQAKVKKGHRVWGARGQFSERDADAYALHMLRKYRRGELKLSAGS